MSAPVINLQSTRGLILMWVCTDPPLSWSENEIVQELEGHGTPDKTARGAIAALRGRGLLRPGRYMSRDHGTLAATSAGYAAIRAHLPASQLSEPDWPGEGPWVHVPGEGHLTEEQYSEHIKETSDE